MIRDYAKDLATQMGIQLSDVSLVDGHDVGCRDLSLLKLSAEGHLSKTLVHRSDLDGLQSGNFCDRLELKIRTALRHLKMLLENNQRSDFWTI